MNKVLFSGIGLIIVLIIVGGVFAYNSYQDKIIPIDCTKQIDVIFLKHSELGSASDIANHINGVVVIPEDNQIIGRSEVLLCPNFDASKYINTGDIF
jgi:hypothetical protein